MKSISLFSLILLAASFIQASFVLDYKANVNAHLPEDKNFQQHPCRRECQVGKPMECHYKIVIHYQEILGPECQQCLYNQTACPEEQCIYGDGVPNTIMTVNNQWPVPAIEVCQHDMIVAEVVNLLDENTTMHWHGMHMQKAKEMDGAPFITQNPIKPGDSYLYKFRADRSGTVWYHSHMMWQRGLGIAAPFVIRQAKQVNPFADLYDYDLLEHTLLISDSIYNNQFDTPRNILVNGKGRNHLNSWPDNDERHRYEHLRVKSGKRYRMRVISNGVSDCPLEVTIDQHKMLTIATDGNNMEPMLADNFFLTSAERLDFIMEANQKPGKYWLKVKGHTDCGVLNLYQGVVLEYEEALNDSKINPRTNMEFSEEKYGLQQLNIISEARTSSRKLGRAMLIDGTPTLFLRSLNPLPWSRNTKFLQFYSSFGRYEPNITYMQADDISFVYPSQPLLLANDLGYEPICDRSNFTNAGVDCTVTNCQCTNVMQIPANQPIELIVTNFMNSTHPFHLHGYTFRLMGQASLSTVEELRNIQKLVGRLQRVPDDYPAIEKDTVQMPPLGYIIIRFMSNNTGYWLYHCHIESHALKGMVGVIHVKE